MMNNKEILLRPRLPHEQNCKFRAPGPHAVRGGMSFPCPRSQDPALPLLGTASPLVILGNSALLWREHRAMSWEENISSSAHINVWAYTASSMNLLVVLQYIINLRQ